MSTGSAVSSHPDHAAAKAGDQDAAARLVLDLAKPDKLRALARQFPNAIVVPVHAEEAAGKNQIPAKFAVFFGAVTGLEVHEGIVQANKVGRTGKGAWHRLAFRPQFDGPVKAGRDYILVDDIVTGGGSLGELRRYIEARGGRVTAMSTMGYAQFSTNIALSEQTRLALVEKFGETPLREFLEAENLYGGEYRALTESEARTLLRAGSLDAARDRLFEAGLESLRAAQPGVFSETRRPSAAQVLAARGIDPGRPGPLHAPRPAGSSPLSGYAAASAEADAQQARASATQRSTPLTTALRQRERLARDAREMWANFVSGNIDRIEHYAPGFRNIWLDTERQMALARAAVNGLFQNLHERAKKGFGYPAWWRRPAVWRRWKRFQAELLPVAARLEAAGVDAKGNFIWQPFDMRARVEEAYGDTMAQMPDWKKAMEGLRMLDQLRATGSITEAVLRHLEAVIQVLREAFDAATPIVKREIEAIQAVLKEFGYENGQVKPDAPKKPAKPRAKKNAEAAAKSPATESQQPTETPAIESLPPGSVVRSDTYRGEGEITITGPASKNEHGDIQYPAEFSGTKRGGTIQARHITSVVSVPAQEMNVTPEASKQPKDSEPSPVNTEVEATSKSDTEAETTAQPALKEGDRVTWTSGGRTYTGTVTSAGRDESRIKTDQFASAGGVPIGRVDHVPNERLRLIEEPAQERDAGDEALAEAFDGLFSAPAPDPVVAALRTLAENDELFRFPVVTGTSSLSEIVTQVFPGSRYLGDATRPDERDESTADRRQMFQTPNGKEFYVYTTGDEVWIDVSRLEEGDGGAAIYAAVGNYAFNADKAFVGDPAGLSDPAIIRRTSHMLSLALRYGTTRHIEPAREQLDGKPEKGIAPLRWTGNYQDKVKALIESFLSTARNLYPDTTDATYDFDTGVFRDAPGRVDAAGENSDPRRLRPDGLPLRRGREAEGGDFEGARPGETTNRRIVFLQSLVSATSEEQSRLLENFRRWGRAYVKDGGLRGLFSAPAPTQQDLPKDRREAMLKAAGVLIDIGVKSPEELARRLDKLAPGGALRPYSRSFWRLMSGFDSSLEENPDWNAVYGSIDGAAMSQESETGDTSTEPVAAVNTSAEVSNDTAVATLRVAESVRDKLLGGGTITASDRKQLHPEGFTPKDMDEAIELGTTLAARRIVEDGGTPQEIFRKLTELYQRQPKLWGGRTSPGPRQRAYLQYLAEHGPVTLDQARAQQKTAPEFRDRSS